MPCLPGKSAKKETRAESTKRRAKLHVLALKMHCQEWDCSLDTTAQPKSRGYQNGLTRCFAAQHKDIRPLWTLINLPLYMNKDPADQKKKAGSLGSRQALNPRHFYPKHHRPAEHAQTCLGLEASRS